MKHHHSWLFNKGLILLGVVLLPIMFSIVGIRSFEVQSLVAAGNDKQDHLARSDTDIRLLEAAPVTQPSNSDNFTLFLPVVSDSSTAFCRFGVNLNTLAGGESSQLSNYDVESLGLGWYINYDARQSDGVSSKIEHAPMIRVRETSSTTYEFLPQTNVITAIAEDNPGADWFVGNEPDRLYYQDGIRPGLYAEAYHELYHLLKSEDPTAKIYAGSIVQPTDVRLKYLDLVLESYERMFGQSLPADGWSIHNFVLNEASCDHYGDLSICWGADIPPGVNAVDGLRIGIDQHHDIELFKEHIVNFRLWMNENGYNGQSLYLSEYGVLLPDWYRPAVDFSPERVNQFMSESFDYLLNERDETLGNPADDFRMVQRLSWYSVNDSYLAGSPYTYNGNLFNPRTFERSEMGDHYAHYTDQIEREVDLYPVAIEVQTETVAASLAGNTVALKAKIANSGNQVYEHELLVTFYDGDPAAGGEKIGDSQLTTLSGCGDTKTVEVNWSSVSAGDYNIYVLADSDQSITETDEDNNLFSAEISISPNTTLWFPVTPEE